jgi:hypothetical protein
MPNLFQRLASGASNIAQRAGENLMPAPADGLLSPEDLARARQQGLLHLGMSLLGDQSGQGLGPAIAHGLGDAQTSFQQTANDRLQQQAAAKQKQILALRQQVSQKYAPQQGDTPAKMIERMPSMYMDLMRAGDMEGAHQLQGVIEELAKRDSKVEPLQTVQMGDRVLTFNPKTGQYTDAEGKPVTDLTRHKTREDRALQRQLQEEQIASARAARAQMMGMSAGNAFQRQNKDLIGTEQLYENWDASYHSARDSKNPAAYKSAIVNFSRIADPGQRSSLGMLNYLEKVNPSLVGKFKLTAQKLADGTFPPEVLDAMNQHVIDIHKNHVKLYETRRAGRVKAQPSYDPFIPPTEEVFPSGSRLLKPQDEVTPDGRVSRVDQFLKGFRGN